MGKQERGLPASFSLDVEKPVALGDYLDEKPIAPPAIKSKKAPIKEEKIVEIKKAKKFFLSKGSEARRMQVNMTPEVERMIDELKDYVQTHGREPSTTASEIIDALIMILYESRAELDLSSVPKRGQWGSPAARAFPTLLGKAFSEAIMRNTIQKTG